jgi:phosphoribosylformylglycinamidine cyclo-ligase
MFGRARLNDFITGKKIESGDVIIGLRSGGRLNYEEGLNSGIMSNGLTLARSCLMKPQYTEKYPELSHPNKNRYTGKYCFDEHIDSLHMSVGEALLSPTRLYGPIVSTVLEEFRLEVHGMVHNTGGGQTKCLRLGTNIKYVKNNLPEPDPIFKLIKKDSGVKWREMYQDFNMGIGFEFVVKPDTVGNIIELCKKFGIGVYRIGYCTESFNGNSLVIKSEFGDFQYK